MKSPLALLRALFRDPCAPLVISREACASITARYVEQMQEIGTNLRESSLNDSGKMLVGQQLQRLCNEARIELEPILHAGGQELRKRREQMAIRDRRILGNEVYAGIIKAEIAELEPGAALAYFENAPDPWTRRFVGRTILPRLTQPEDRERILASIYGAELAEVRGLADCAPGYFQQLRDTAAQTMEWAEKAYRRARTAPKE